MHKFYVEVSAMNNYPTKQSLPQSSDPPQGSIVTDLQESGALFRDRTIQFGKLDQWVNEAFDKSSKE